MDKNCDIPLQGCNQVLQPIQRATFLKYNFKTDYNGGTPLSVAKIGNTHVQKVYDETTIAKTLASGKQETLNDVQLLTKQFIFCGIKFKVSDFSLMDNNPKLVYIQGQQKKDVEIDLQKYMTEFAYKNNILTVPVKFLMDNRAVILWQLPVPASASDSETAVITMNIEKVINEVYSL